MDYVPAVNQRIASWVLYSSTVSNTGLPMTSLCRIGRLSVRHMLATPSLHIFAVCKIRDGNSNCLVQWQTLKLSLLIPSNRPVWRQAAFRSAWGIATAKRKLPLLEIFQQHCGWCRCILRDLSYQSSVQKCPHSCWIQMSFVKTILLMCILSCK